LEGKEAAEELLEKLQEVLQVAIEFADATNEWQPRNALTLAVSGLKQFIEKEEERCRSTNTNAKNVDTSLKK
jgi:hypothetical protein